MIATAPNEPMPRRSLLRKEVIATKDFSFDLFVVHAQEDDWFVRGILLPALGLRTGRVQSTSEMTPGDSILLSLERYIDSSRVTVVIFSTHFFSDTWSQYADLLATHSEIDSQVTVIPLVLEDCPLLLHTRAKIFLDLRNRSQWTAQFSRLREIIGRRRSKSPDENSDNIACPYPGMRPFQEGDREHFFGRDQEIEDLVQHLRAGERQLYIIGPSASGKSSLIAAGLIPRLERGVSGLPNILTLTLRPGEHPYRRLSALLDAGSDDLSAAIDNLASSNKRLLLFIDQLEEIFTLSSRDDRERFIESLAELRGNERCILLLCLRADFFGELIQSSLWLGHRTLHIGLAPLRGTALRDALVRPAQTVGVYLEPSLIATLLTDAGSEPGILPLLQETLVQLWDRRQFRVITIGAYNNPIKGAYGFASAISRHADACLRAMTSMQALVARRILLRLIALGDEPRLVRRQQTRTALAEGQEQVLFTQALDMLTSYRLVVIDRSSKGDILVDLAHESLLSSWAALAAWITKQRQDEVQRRVWTSRVSEWHSRRDLDPTAGLLDTVDLRQAQAWMAREDMAGVGEVADLQGLIHASGISHDTAKATHAAARQQLSKIYQEFGRQLYLDGRCQQALPYMAAAREFGDSNESLQMMFRIATKSTIVSTALHRGVVNGVVFSADGRCFVTASDDGTACVWDSLSGTPITPFLKHGAPVATAVFSPDGHHIITACADGTARLWCSDTGQPMCEPLRHPDIVWVATFSPNGELAATLCISGLVQIWNAKTGALLDRAPSHSRRLWSGSFSPDSRYFATASADGYAHLYDMDTKKCVFLEHGGEVLSSTFNNDGSRIATTGSNGLVRLWNVRRGDCYGELRHEDLVWKAVFCSDGKRIASVSRDRTARIWNADTGELACTPLRHEDELWDISFNPDGRFVVTAGRSTAAQIWDTHDGRPVDPPLEHGGPIWTAAFSRDGCHIATASSDYKARIWNVVASCETIHRSFKHNGPVRSSVFSRDGTRVVTSSDDDTARVWDSVTGKAVTPPMEHASWVRRASFSPDGRLVVSEGSDNVARVWSAGEGTLHFCCSHDGSMLHAKFSPDGRSILTTNDSTARIWMLPVQLPSIELHHVDTVRYAEFSKSGALVGTACDNGEAHIWRSDGTHLRVHKYSTAVIRVLFNPTKETYAIICSSGQIDIWRMKTNTVEIKIRHQDTIFAAFSSDGNLLVTASADKTACIWDVTSGQLRSPPLKHENAVISAAFSPLGGRIATVSCDGTFAIWDSQSGRPLTPLAHQPSRVLDVSFSPDGEHLAISSEDGITQIVDIGMDQRSLSDWMHIVSRCPYSISNGMLNVSVLGDWVEEAVTGEDADAETAGEPAAVPRPGIREYRLGATLMGFPSLRGRPRGRMT